MDIDKSKLILKKINRLYDLINEFGEASDTEKDLIKAYVIDLYGAVISDGNEDLEAEEMRKKLKKRKKLEKKMRKKEKGEKKVVKTKVAETMEAEPTEPVATLTPSRPATIPEPALKPKASPVVETVKVAASAQPAVSNQLKELFEVSAGDDLSDKLSQRPIKDLTKAMGINEKIFTVNELFGGNSDEMNNMLVALNGLSSYDEAKNVLIRSVASKYDWSSDAKVKKARTFLKLVSRRYN